MFRNALTFAFVLIFAFLVFIQGRQLTLAFYVLFPILLFPLYDFYNRECRRAAALTFAVIFLLYAAFFLYHPRLSLVLFGAGFAGVAACLAAYRHQWVRGMREEIAEGNKVEQELEVLKKKYTSRIDSLQHLEKQAASLSELFEIARDFNESLSFESLTDLLFKKVLPLLPFVYMQLVLVSRTTEGSVYPRHFMITSKGVKENSGEFESGEVERFRKAEETKQLLKIQSEDAGVKTEEWIFPLVIDNEVAGLLDVKPDHPEDLVKFEVLVAQLVLQVKKIRLYETVKELSTVDGLTGVYVRRYFLERFKEELKRAIKYGLPLAVLMLDIDHFKRYNDEFGHLVGDATLNEVSTILRESVRKVDILARYGGEEFIAVLPETGAQNAAEVAERIRSNIARHSIRVYDVKTKVTVSIGIALFPSDVSLQKLNEFYEDLTFDLIRHADKALYRAKEEGRNRVIRYQDLS